MYKNNIEISRKAEKRFYQLYLAVKIKTDGTFDESQFFMELMAFYETNYKYYKGIKWR